MTWNEIFDPWRASGEYRRRNGGSTGLHGALLGRRSSSSWSNNRVGHMGIAMGERVRKLAYEIAYALEEDWSLAHCWNQDKAANLIASMLPESTEELEEEMDRFREAITGPPKPKQETLPYKLKEALGDTSLSLKEAMELAIERMKRTPSLKE